MRRAAWLLRGVIFAWMLVTYASEAKPTAAAAQQYPPQLEGARVEVYKEVGDVRLNLYLFLPPDWTAADQRPALVFFFGGGWRSGSPQQFEPHCRHLAARGMVAITADYRVASRHQVLAKDCVADAKSAVRWLRAHAKGLGIDPQRLAAGGGSAGGHLAACTAVIEGFEEASEDRSVSSRPNALVLFNPAVTLPSRAADSPRWAELRQRMGVEPERLSPYHQVRGGLPPTIIFHGAADTTVPPDSVQVFAQAMQKAGNRCELKMYEGQGHGFFNYARGEKGAYASTLQAMDAFLVSLGYLAPAPPREESPPR